MYNCLTPVFLPQFIIAALALSAVADRPQTRYAPAPVYRPQQTYAPAPVYRPEPTYAPPAPTYAAPTYAAPTYAAPTYAPPTYGAQPSYRPIAILEEENVHPGDGTYNFHFSAENGIYR